MWMTMASVDSGLRAFVGGKISQNSPGELMMVGHPVSYFQMMMLFLNKKQERRTGFQGAKNQIKLVTTSILLFKAMFLRLSGKFSGKSHRAWSPACALGVCGSGNDYGICDPSLSHLRSKGGSRFGSAGAMAPVKCQNGIKMHSFAGVHSIPEG